MKQKLIVLALAAATFAATAAPASAAPTYDIQPGALPRGANVQIAHIEGSSVVDGSTRIRVVAAHLELLGQTGTGYVIRTYNADFDNAQVWRLQSDGSRTRLLHGRYAEDVIVSDRGAKLVSNTFLGRDRSQLLVIDVASGGSTGSRQFSGRLTLLDVDGPRVAVGSWSQPRTFIWNTSSHTTRTLVNRPGAFTDLSSDQFSFYTKDPYLGGCTVLTHVSQPARVSWRSCEERIQAINPDGSRIATIHILSDGIGPSRVTVRTSTGTKLATYDAALYFGAVRFEDRYDLLLDTTGKKYAATARCDLAGCERASELHRPIRT